MLIHTVRVALPIKITHVLRFFKKALTSACYKEV